jgi:hypothetical protein
MEASLEALQRVLTGRLMILYPPNRVGIPALGNSSHFLTVAALTGAFPANALPQISSVDSGAGSLSFSPAAQT